MLSLLPIRFSRLLRGIAAATAVAVPAFAGLSGQALAASYDGNWSVLIVTEKGDCDAAYRYEVKVNNGAISYAGGGDFTVSGRVGGNGAVTVSIRRGAQGASGSGRLGGAGGSGRWSGKSATAACSGRWQAEKR